MMKKIIALFVILAIALSCQKETEDVPVTQDVTTVAKNFPMNPTLEELGTIPSATVPLLNLSKAMSLKDAIASYLLPDNFETTLMAGESVSETKDAFIDGAPPKGDILFMMDLTGSMGGVVSNAKANSINIMTQIGSVIADASFGLVTHKDYPGSYSSCGYSSIYGSTGDFPYNLDQAITSDNTVVSGAIDLLSVGGGSDLPESYTRVLYETTADENIGWRTGARKFVVAWLDAMPHDCGAGYGADPGRDGVMGTIDDLPDISPVLQEMKAQNLTLIVLCINSLILSDWQAWAQETGGDAFQVNGDGTIAGTDIATYITDLIEEQTATINDLAVKVCTPGFEAWLTGAPSWTDVDLTDPFLHEGFDITFTVPEGTEDGVYEFNVCLVGDGAEYGSQHVVINVVNVITVPFDVSPDALNRQNKGVTPMVIFGSDEFDVNTIDVGTLLIGGVPPLMWSFDDANADGIMDLTLKFNTPELALDPLFSSANKGDVVTVTITGVLLDGTPIIGEDVITIVK